MFSAMSLDVIDPCNRTGKINIPTKYVVGTKGVSDFRSNPAKRDGKELSLCLLFQKGRCNAGSKCHQVHADPEYVNTLREQALSVKNCCAAHGDVHSAGFLKVATTTVTLLNSEGKAQSYPLASFGRTSFLDTLLRSASNSVVRAQATKVCRLHTQSRCKFGKDCKNLHLCPDAAPVTETTPKRVAVPPVSVDMSCGLSSGSTSGKGSEDSTPIVTPKKGAPITSLDSGMFGSEQEFSYVSSMWGAVASPQFDMSAFEDTIRGICLDLTIKDDPLAVAPPKRE